MRTDNNASAPLSSSADFRRLLAQAVRNSHEELLAKLSAVLKGRSALPEKDAVTQFESEIKAARSRWGEINPYRNKGYQSYVEFIFRPEMFEKHRFGRDTLLQAAHKGFQDFRGWPFLFISHNRPDCTYNVTGGIETVIAWETSIKGDMLDFWRFLQSGLFFQRKLLYEDTHEQITDQKKILELRYNAAYFAEAVRCLTRLYEDLLPASEVISLSVRYVGMKNRKLIDRSQRFFSLDQTSLCRENEIATSRTMSLAEWECSGTDTAAEMAKEVFELFNWGPGKEVMIRKMQDDLLNRRW